MKMQRNIIKAVFLCSLSSFMACNESEKPITTTNEKSNLNIYQVPKSGTNVASYSIPFKNKKLNNEKFAVEVFTNEQTAKDGTFDLIVTHGTIEEKMVEVFPKWTQNNVVQPVIKRVDSLDYGVLLGFNPGDGSFQDLYLISYKNKELVMQQTKRYAFTQKK